MSLGHAVLDEADIGPGLLQHAAARADVVCLANRLLGTRTGPSLDHGVPDVHERTLSAADVVEKTAGGGVFGTRLYRMRGGLR